MEITIVNKEKLNSGDERHPFQVMSESKATYESYSIKPCGVWVFHNCVVKGKLPDYAK